MYPHGIRMGPLPGGTPWDHTRRRRSRPGGTQIVLVLSYLSTLGLNDWLLAGGGLEALFVGMKEGHGM